MIRLGFPIPTLAIPILALSWVASCSSARAGWASRGQYRVLQETQSLQVRRGSQTLDPRTGEIVLAWVGVRAPDGQPPLVSCELTVFDDLDADGAPGSGEIRCVRESREKTVKILFGDVRARAAGAKDLRAKLVASTERESCAVSWRLAPD